MGSGCVFHSEWTVRSLGEGQNQLRWGSFLEPPQLVSIYCANDTFIFSIECFQAIISFQSYTNPRKGVQFIAILKIKTLSLRQA